MPVQSERLQAMPVSAAPFVPGGAGTVPPASVPLGYTVLRARGITTGPTGRPLLFGDLFHHGVARATLATATTGFAAVLAGILAGSPTLVAGGGALVSSTGALATVNLAGGPRRAARAHPPASRAAPTPAPVDLVSSGRTS